MAFLHLVEDTTAVKKDQKSQEVNEVLLTMRVVGSEEVEEKSEEIG